MPKWTRGRWIAVGLVAAALLLSIYAFGIEPYWIQVTWHDVGTGSRKMTILHITDLHFSTPGSREKRLLEILLEFKPDLIVITGDSIVRNYDQATFTELMAKLKAPLGTYACRGNWEDWVGTSVDKCYQFAGVRLLNDETVQVGDLPVDMTGFSNFKPTVPKGSGRFRIALCHYPVILPVAAEKGVNLVFAGHTHGGQVRLPFIGALHTPFGSGPYEAGWYEERATRMYVSRGVGTSMFGARFLCRPEVAIHRVRY
jgi:predicted MPP superfamily phosphohydrolase